MIRNEQDFEEAERVRNDLAQNKFERTPGGGIRCLDKCLSGGFQLACRVQLRVPREALALGTDSDDESFVRPLPTVHHCMIMINREKLTEDLT